MGFSGRYLTLNAAVRVNQIEVRHDLAVGEDERALHTPEAVEQFREAVRRGFPEGRVSWAFSWQALNSGEANYRAVRELVRGYVNQYGDEFTYLAGGYFANAYNTREKINGELKAAVEAIGSFMGSGYKPKAVIAGFLAAENQEFLAKALDIHVCQGTIWSQYAIDNQDGDGSVCYPYYPSKEHFCKPAQRRDDFIDCVCLDGWSVDFLAGRREGFQEGFNSRLGVGPIETLRNHGPETGLRQMLHTTAVHFETNYRRNGFAFVPNMWEICLVPLIGCLDKLSEWLAEIRRRWPDTRMPTMGEFGLAWRSAHAGNDWAYRFDEEGSGIGGSDKDKHIRWYMTPRFRLAFLWPRGKAEAASVIDFTRYDLPAAEPAGRSRNWSLLGTINQKQTRPQDRPRSLAQLDPGDRDLILAHYPELEKGVLGEPDHV